MNDQLRSDQWIEFSLPRLLWWKPINRSSCLLLKTNTKDCPCEIACLVPAPSPCTTLASLRLWIGLISPNFVVNSTIGQMRRGSICMYVIKPVTSGAQSAKMDHPVGNSSGEKTGRSHVKRRNRRHWHCRPISYRRLGPSSGKRSPKLFEWAKPKVKSEATDVRVLCARLETKCGPLLSLFKPKRCEHRTRYASLFSATALIWGLSHWFQRSSISATNTTLRLEPFSLCL